MPGSENKTTLWGTGGGRKYVWPHGGGRPEVVVLSQLLLHVSYVFSVLAVASKSCVSVCLGPRSRIESRRLKPGSSRRVESIRFDCRCPDPTLMCCVL